MCVWTLYFSIHEMNMDFKGNYADKISMTHKSEGDGLKLDAIFQKGYTYQTFMSNDFSQNILSQKTVANS